MLGNLGKAGNLSEPRLTGEKVIALLRHQVLGIGRDPDCDIW